MLMLHHNLLLSTAEDNVVCRFVVLWPDGLTGLRYSVIITSRHHTYCPLLVFDNLSS